MFKKLVNVFSNGPTKQEIIDDVKAQFKRDYIDNVDFINHVPSEIVPFLTKHIQETLDESDDDISILFSGLELLYVFLWLAETGYGKRLVLRMNQLVYTDEYGDICYDDCEKEMRRFFVDRIYKLDSYIRESIPIKYQSYAKELKMLDMLMIDLDDSIGTELSIESLSTITLVELPSLFQGVNQKNQLFNLNEITDPYDYEHAISNEFCSLGWESRATTGSGDQGADVIAEKQGVRLIIQCKLYSSPVGNKAVQEVAAASGYYDGDFAAVITNNEYTKSAKQLADSLNVFLLHHSQIEALDEMLFEDFEIEEEGEEL